MEELVCHSTVEEEPINSEKRFLFFEKSSIVHIKAFGNGIFFSKKKRGENAHRHLDGIFSLFSSLNEEK